MPKTSSNHLYKLVQSLSKKERNELLHFIGNQESAIAKLFTAMKKCADVEKPFSEKTLSIKNLPVVKSNLQNAIEDYLMSMPKPEGFLRNAFKKYELIRQLIERGFYPQALQKIEKLKAEATEREEFALLSYLLITENMYYDRLHPHHTAQNRMVENWEQCTIANCKNLHMIEMSALNAKVVAIETPVGSSLSKEQQLTVQEVKEQLIGLTSSVFENCRSYKSQSTCLATQMFIAELEGDEAAAKEFSCADVALLNQYPQWRRFNPTGYAATTLNHLSRFQQTPLHRQFSEPLKTFDNDLLSPDMQALFRPKFLPYWHLYYLYQQNQNELQKIVAEQESYRQIEVDSFTLLFAIQNNLQAAVYHIINGNTTQALENLDWIIDKGTTEYYPEFFLKAYTWKILLLAQSNHKTLESIIRRFQYHLTEYLPENKFFQTFCNLALKHLNQEFSSAMVAEKLENEFAKETQNLIAEPELDIITWMQSKGEKPSEMMKRKIDLAKKKKH